MAKILIIDDDPDFVRATRIILEKHNHETITADGGDAGYNRAVKEKPDLVILDVMMDTVLDGLSVSQRMHDDPKLKETPIIMVTSIANTDYAELFPTDEYIHINAFMSKPISADQLMRQVNKHLPKD
jgi:two-component system, OmpR family, alkaline phosphatase synthesis response regulator PhoP